MEKADIILHSVIENKNNLLEDLKEVNLEGKEVRKIILDNFSKLFPHLELFNKGNPFALPHGFRGKKIPDSLAIRS